MSLIAGHALEWKKGGLTLKANRADSLLTAAGVSVSQGVGGQHAASTGAGGAASELTGATMAAGDEMYWFLDPLSDLWMADLRRDLQLQVAFQGGNAADSGVVWGASIKGIASGDTLVDAKVASDGTIAFPAQTIVATDKLIVTEGRGFKLPQTAFANAAGDPTKDMLALAVTLTSSGTASADELVLLWARLLFTLNPTHSSGIQQFT